MSKYTDIINTHPELVDCFFAFSNQQINEGWDKIGRDKEIVSGGHGLFGTEEGIRKLWADYAARSKRVTEECDPQEVYDHEFHNHECSYNNDDSECIRIVVSYFGVEKALTVKRKYGYLKIEDIK